MKHTVATVAALLAASSCASMACTDAVKLIGPAERASFAKAAERHLRSHLPSDVARLIRVSEDDILAYISLEHWRILRVETHATDPAYLFYSARPDRSRTYVSLWSGAARKDEAATIEQWVLENVAGSTRALAACFSRLVTDSTAK